MEIVTRESHLPRVVCICTVDTFCFVFVCSFLVHRGLSELAERDRTELRGNLCYTFAGALVSP